MIMKPGKIIICCIISLFAITLSAQNITLPKPVKNGGMPLMEALNKRSSVRVFDTQKLIDNQTLSNMLWAAWGYNRDKKRTAPSAMDKQEIDIYVFTVSGVYKYDAAHNQLIQITQGNHRKATGQQDFVYTAPINLIYVADTKKSSQLNMCYTDAGFIAQNVYLFCAANKLGTVVRGSFDEPSLQKILNLPSSQKVILAQTIGYPKAK